MSRGALIGFVLGGVYPILFAISVNGGLAARKMVYPILLQSVFAAYLASRQYKLLIKALQSPEPDIEIH
ncbi:hypothetical protein A6R68_17645, partial [Neotoma lepida]